MKYNFIDTAEVEVQGGKGGNGAVAFHRAMYVPKGGPSGGDGGKGGDIYFMVDTNLNTLLDLRLRKKIIGASGGNGSNKMKLGFQGKDTFVKVPLGTKIIDKNKAICVGDLIKTNDQVLVAKGGVGGRGNKSFASSSHKAPSLFENGLPGEIRFLGLELQVLADVGLIGLPNAGKSTLLSVISNSTPKIANYPFTTLEPQLGVVQVDKGQSFVCADLPGLIAGASAGKGLGDLFLKHVSRCLVIAHVIDMKRDKADQPGIIDDFQQIRLELKNYNQDFMRKKMIVIATKVEDKEAEANCKFLQRYLKKNDIPIPVVAVSALMHQHLAMMKYKICEILTIAQKTKQLKIQQSKNKPADVKVYSYSKVNQDFKIAKLQNHVFAVTGEAILKLVNRVSLSTRDNYIRFNQILKKMGVFDALVKQNIQPKDTVKLYNVELVWK